MKNKRTIVIYPILFGLYPYLNLYASNLGKAFRFSELTFAILLTLGITAAVWLTLGLVWKSIGKAAFFCFVLQLLFFSYGHLYDYLVDSRGWTWLNDTDLLTIWCIITVVALLVTMRWGKNLTQIWGVLNVVSITLIIFPLYSIVKAHPNRQPYNEQELLVEPFDIRPTATGYGDTLPDIYYIILDGFPREDVLAEFYDYDNSAFTNHLREMGFYVADKSQANYLNTGYSMVSSLNANYLQTVLKDVDVEGKPWFFLDGLIGKNALCPTLKNIGYYHIAYDNTAPIFSDSTCADAVRGYNHLDQLDTILLQTTVLRPFLANTVTDSYRQSQQFIFTDLPKIAKLDQPTFTYAHILLPHPPLVFDRNGKPLDIPVDKYWLTPGSMSEELHASFLEQTIYTATQIQYTVEQILANSKEPPIIILQSDHGSFPPTENTLGWRYLRERVPNLNAYYLPKGGEALLYPSISPVNSFRVVLNYYFGADLPYLEDVTYHTSLLDENPFQYTDVTLETIYEDEQVKILRSWDGESYQVEQIQEDNSIKVGDFSAQQMIANYVKIDGIEGWSITLETDSPSHHILSLYNPTGQFVGRGFIDTNVSDMHRYDLAQQDYYDLLTYREESAPLVPLDATLIKLGLTTRSTDADRRSIGSYISLSTNLAPEDRESLFDLMILLDRVDTPDDESLALDVSQLSGDYILLKDGEQWQQSHTEEWFALNKLLNLEHLELWDINVADRSEPIRYDLYRSTQNKVTPNSPTPTFILSELYKPNIPIIINSPTESLNTFIQDYLLAGADVIDILGLTAPNSSSLTNEVIANIQSFLGQPEQFWYIEAPETFDSEARIMKVFASLGYLRGRAQPIPADQYYSTLRIFTFHRIPTKQDSFYVFGEEQIGLYAWSLETPTNLTTCQVVRLQTWWISQRVPKAYYRMSIILTDVDGNRVINDDLELSEVLMTQWRPKEPYLDERWFTIPCELALGEYEVLIDVYSYNYETEEIISLPVSDTAGVIVEIASLGQIYVDVYTGE